MAPDASKKPTDSVPTDTGFVTVNCLGGVLVRSGAVCVTPQVVDVRGPTGCVNGYCSAAAGECGVADPNAATAICVAKGFATQTTFTTMEGARRGQPVWSDRRRLFRQRQPHVQHRLRDGDVPLLRQAKRPLVGAIAPQHPNGGACESGNA
ncbi:MAG: hypothetical protein IPG50_11735 [Myxococcales bacterium]|nr:hypothetical protein [Myxococcales bacterium]